jgi:hypothetical protein
MLVFELGMGALVFTVCGWSILHIARSGAVSGRMGGKWTRYDAPGTYWLCISALTAGLSAGAFLLAAGLGTPNVSATIVAVLIAAGSLIAVGRYGRREAAR